MKKKIFLLIVAVLFATVVSAQGVEITEKGGKEVISLLICVFAFMVGILSPRWSMATINRLFFIAFICIAIFITTMMTLSHYLESGLIVTNAVWFILILLATSGIFFGEGGVSLVGTVTVVSLYFTFICEQEWLNLILLSIFFFCGVRSRVLSERKLTTLIS